MRRIAVGVDGSETSLRAVDFAAKLAAATAAELAIVTVLDHAYLGDRSLKQFVRAEHLTAWGDLLETRAAQILAIATRRASGHGCGEPRAEWRAGAVAAEVARFARENEADMLVVGHAGCNELAGLVLGSVAMKLLTLSPCPLTVVR